MPINDWRNAQIGQSLGIDPAILAQLLAARQYSGGSASGGYDASRPPSEVNRDGLTYSALYDYGTGPQGEAGMGNTNGAGYTGQMLLYDPKLKRQDAASFDEQGNFQGSMKLEEDNYLQTLAMALAAGAGVYGLGSMLGGGAASGAAGAANGMWDVLPEAAASSGSSTAAMGAGGAGLTEAAASAYPEIAASHYAAGSTLMSPIASSLAADLPLVSTAAGAGGLFSGLSDVAKYALPLAGALSGAQAAKGDTTTQSKQMDPEMRPYIYGDLFPRTKGLLERQAPIAERTGQGLLALGNRMMDIPLMANPWTKERG